MNKIVLTTLFLCPSVYCGGDGGYPLRRSPEIADIKELKEEIAALKKELAEAKTKVTEADGTTKRTDVKKLLGDQADVDNLSTDMATMDMVLTCVTVDGVQKDMHCDVPGCKEIAHTMWFSVDTGIMIKRCNKHKDGVVVK